MYRDWIVAAEHAADPCNRAVGDVEWNEPKGFRECGGDGRHQSNEHQRRYPVEFGHAATSLIRIASARQGRQAAFALANSRGCAETRECLPFRAACTGRR